MVESQFLMLKNHQKSQFFLGEITICTVFFATLITSFVGEITMKFSLFEVDDFPMVRPPASPRTAWGFLGWSCSAVEDFTQSWTRKIGIFPGKSRSFPGKNPGISRGTVGFDYESG